MSFAQSINASGQVVGYGLVDGNEFEHAFLYSGGTMSDLNSLLAPDSNWTLDIAEAINSQGDIVGIGTNPAGKSHAFLLTPSTVPEPASATILSLGMFAMLGRRRRGFAQ